MEDCIRKTAVETLDVITAGEATPHPAEVLDVEAIGRLVDEMKFYYDLILVDTVPPRTAGGGLYTSLGG